MRSPFSGAPSQSQDVTAQNLWLNAVNFLVKGMRKGIGPLGFDVTPLDGGRPTTG